MVKPRPASTIVLARMAPHQKYDLYMTQRPLHFSFLGGYYVFPGGSVDAKDDQTIEHIPCKWPKFPISEFPKSHWVAAVRETFEETGVLLARNSEGEWTWNRKYDDDRHALLKGELTFPQFLSKHRLSLDFSILNYLGRRITPADSPIRFDTRFFLAVIPEHIHCEPFQHEVIADEWLKPQEALQKWKSGKMPLVPPTVQVLQALANYSHIHDLHHVSIGEQFNLSF